MVADELAAALSKDRRTAGETCVLFLAVVGRATSAPAAVWPDAAADLGVADAERVAKQERQRIERSEAI